MIEVAHRDYPCVPGRGGHLRDPRGVLVIADIPCAAGLDEPLSRRTAPRDIDVGVLTLALFAAGGAPELLPQLAAAFTGADPASPEFIDHYADELARVVYALAELANAAGEGPAKTEADPAEGAAEAVDRG